MDEHDATRRTFRARAADYDGESGWMADITLVSPLVTRLPDQEALIDVCAGTGAVGLEASAAGWEKVIAVDASPEMVEVGRSKGDGLRWLVGDGHLDWFHERADVVVCRQGLQYLDRARALTRWAQIATHEVRLAHITTWEREDVPLWLAFFEIASPGRLTVFAPGQVAATCRGLGLHVHRETVRDSLELLDPGLAHLAPAARSEATLRFASIAERCPDHDVTRAAGDSTQTKYRVRWEFLSVRA